jgi:voltage-gated potassium channel
MAEARRSTGLGGRRARPWAPLRWPAVALVVIVVYGVTGYMVMEDWSFIDAVYMTVTALTTVGFGEVRPLDDAGKVFTVSLVVFGVTLALITFSLIAAVIAERRPGERLRRRRMQKKIDDLKDHCIVCAYGRVGRTVAEELAVYKQPFVVVDKSDTREDELIDDGVLYIIGDASEEEALKAAGIDRAKSLVCAVDSDAENVFIALVASTMRPDLFIVARSAEAESNDKLRRAGANAVFSPYETGGRQMADTAVRGVAP